MTKMLQNLVTKKLITPPKWLSGNTMYLCKMGSQAYGVANDDSDIDVYGFCIPPKNNIWRPLNEFIPGFDSQKNFEQWTEHHIKDGEKEYDFAVYNITKYFRLVMDNNPNMIDSLFVPRNCILHSTPIFEMIRENRKLFLHKGSWHKFKGYSFSQMHKMNTKVPDKESKRYESYMRHGYDLKFAYHLVRLLNEAEQILTEGDLDLQRNCEQLKSVRRGDWHKDEIEGYFKDKEKSLEQLYNKSELPYGPDVDKIRKLLFDCLEMHYDLSDAIMIKSSSDEKLDAIRSILNT